MVIVFPEKSFVKKTGTVRQGFYMDGILKNNVDNYVIKAVKNNFDAISCLSGGEGTGKTTFACTLAYYCDQTFGGEDCRGIVFSGKQILNAIDHAKKGQAIVIDEAILALGSQDAARDIQKILIKKFVTIRKKNLYIFLIIPSIHMLRKYFAIFRTRFLLHCYTRDGYSRGYFSLFNRTTKRQLYIRGLKEMDMTVVRPNYRGRFTDTYGMFYNAEKYEQMKDEAIATIIDDPEHKYKLELKAKFDEKVTKLNDYSKQLREKYQNLFKKEKENFKLKLKETNNANKEKLLEINKKIKIAKTGKIKEELQTLVDFRDRLIYKVYEGKSPQEIHEDLRNSSILHYTVQSIQAFYERGKILAELQPGLNT